MRLTPFLPTWRSEGESEPRIGRRPHGRRPRLTAQPEQPECRHHSVTVQPSKRGFRFAPGPARSRGLGTDHSRSKPGSVTSCLQSAGLVFNPRLLYPAKPSVSSAKPKAPGEESSPDGFCTRPTSLVCPSAFSTSAHAAKVTSRGSPSGSSGCSNSAPQPGAEAIETMRRSFLLLEAKGPHDYGSDAGCTVDEVNRLETVPISGEIGRAHV